ncbi:rRNA pseudouridine synthase [Paenalkalicoccus suaedae]|uniref:Pseudouridine synthase n=1 Tax=Paenalkalicoccus suaedae TaxID=2592382 RepID=A0A859FFI2_9BACI|nr:pseudouridine synthase [Paenalkalicoccus suaedae]QKS72113.1 rRNA pseudouridine synthase [Paenalkalicoccus suaedae]
MRADKLLSHLGYGSRKDVKRLLKEGALVANGLTVKDGKVKVDPDKDELMLYGEPVEYREFIYIMLHKPAGTVSATEDTRDQTVIDLLGPDEVLFEPFPVGRLDKDTTGLLLLTNDGKLGHRLTSPKHKVDKEYRVHSKLPLTENDVEVLESGVKLDDGYETKPAKVRFEGEKRDVFWLTIQEGKFHQVKRMLEAVDNKVTALKRERHGSLLLDETLKPGQYRELTEEELQLLMDAD